MNSLIQKTKHVLAGENAYLILEAAIICFVVCIGTIYLLDLAAAVIRLGIIRNGWTSSTGWFRTRNTTGIINPG